MYLKCNHLEWRPCRIPNKQSEAGNLKFCALLNENSIDRNPDKAIGIKVIIQFQSFQL